MHRASEPTSCCAALAARLGADVPAQIAPGRWLASGAGERLRELPAPIHPFGVLVLPVAAGLSTAAVYERADELGTRRTPGELAGIAGELERAFELGAAAPGAQELLHNDLQAAAISLCPQIEPALEQALRRGRGCGIRERLGSDGHRAVPAGQRRRARRARGGRPERTAPGTGLRRARGRAAWAGGRRVGAGRAGRRVGLHRRVAIRTIVPARARHPGASQSLER